MREKGCARLCFLLRSTAITLFSLPDRRGHQALRKECSMPAPSPNIEQLKKQAKDLLKAHKAADPRAALRLRQPSPNSTSPPTRDSPDQARPQRHPARHCPRVRLCPLDRSQTPCRVPDAHQHLLRRLARAAGEDGYAVDAAHMLAIVAPPDSAQTRNYRALAVAEQSQQPHAQQWLGKPTQQHRLDPLRPGRIPASLGSV